MSLLYPPITVLILPSPPPFIVPTLSSPHTSSFTYLFIAPSNLPSLHPLFPRPSLSNIYMAATKGKLELNRLNATSLKCKLVKKKVKPYMLKTGFHFICTCPVDTPSIKKKGHKTWLLVFQSKMKAISKMAGNRNCHHERSILAFTVASRWLHWRKAAQVLMSTSNCSESIH